LLQLTLTEIRGALDVARDSGEALPIWSQLVFVSAGVMLIALAWRIFQGWSNARESRRSTLMAFSGLARAVGG